MDFTLKTYRSLLSALEQSGYAFRTFEEFLSVPAGGKVVVLRHDIDKKPGTPYGWHKWNMLRVSKLLII